jgi:D-alanyl-lipoteichoic acid acyltransferase DltB (MBOAT superfamily)
MLFPTFQFIFVFLPIVLSAVYLLKKLNKNISLVFPLLFFSMIFYLLPNWRDAYVIIFSLLVNYFISGRVQVKNESHGKIFLILGIIFNLCVISYFKYLFFFSEVFAGLTGIGFNIEQLVLPVGISFYTFQQIAYLVDCYKEKNINYKLDEYALFVTFFPQLIAGPIVHHKELLPQLKNLKETLSGVYFNLGLCFFIFGLFKKLVIADNLAEIANPVFLATEKLEYVDMLSAVLATLAYTFQLYFDFSAYSDMAIGLGLMLGIKLPINFFSPYKSKSITEFWRRWHITLSSFLRDYLYIPLGGNRNGKLMRYRNLILTMLLGGLWHGAGWNFIIWGGLHGLYLTINHMFTKYLQKLNFQLHSIIGICVTFCCVAIAWVFFRSETTQGALTMLYSLMSISSGELVYFSWQVIDYGLIIFAAVLAFFAPNLPEFFNYSGSDCDIQEAVDNSVLSSNRFWFTFIVGVLFAFSLSFMSEPTVFLYFNF